MNNEQTEYAAYVAIDWADRKHAFSLTTPGSTKKETGTLEHKPEVINAWIAKLQERFKGGLVAVAVEQSRGALIHALLGYDFLVIYPIHPNTVANFRKAFYSSGSKNDPLDTDQILEILLKHRGQLKALLPDTAQTRHLARLVEDRRKFVDMRTCHVQALIASLKEYFPQAIQILNGNLASRLACDFILKWPTLEAVQQAKPATLRKFLYGHNLRSPDLIEKIIKLVETAKPLTTDEAIIASGSRLSQGQAKLIQSLNPLIADYEKVIQRTFDEHPESKIFSGIPGAGAAMAPRLVAVFGTDRSRYERVENLLSFSGIAPVQKSSGKSKVVLFRHACPKFVRQTFHEFARLSTTDSLWARNYVDYYMEKGKSYHATIRSLAFKWVRILFSCWKNGTPYDERKHLETLKMRGSKFATLHLKPT